jgi:hypothetical protein
MLKQKHDKFQFFFKVFIFKMKKKEGSQILFISHAKFGRLFYATTRLNLQKIPWEVYFLKLSCNYIFILTSHALRPNGGFNMFLLNEFIMHSYHFPALHFMPFQLDTLSLEETPPKSPYPTHDFLSLIIGMFLALWDYFSFF